MKINDYTIKKITYEYKIMKAKEKWNKVSENLTEDQILNFGDKGYTYNQVYDYVLRKGGKDD